MWANSVNSLVFFPSLIQNLKCMSWSQSMWNKDGGGRYFSYSPQLTWSATAPARNRNEKRVTHTAAVEHPLAPAQVWFQKGSRVFWHVLEKSAGPPLVGPVQAGVEQPEEEWQQSASPWHAPSSGRPWQESHQSRRVEFLNFAVPFMFVFSFLSQSVVDCSM